MALLLSDVRTLLTDRDAVVSVDRLRSLFDLDRVDPYLIWALLVSPLKDPEDDFPHIAAVVEFFEPKALSEINGMLPSYWLAASAPSLRVHPVLLTLNQLSGLLDRPDVRRFELSEERTASAKDSAGVLRDLQKHLLLSKSLIPGHPDRESASVPLVCVIDDGANFAASPLVRQAHSRVETIWHQGAGGLSTDRAVAGGQAPVGYGIGWEPPFDSSESDNFYIGVTGRRFVVAQGQGGFRAQPAQADRLASGGATQLTLPEPAIYAANGYPQHLFRWTHGSAVLGLIAADRLWGVGPSDHKGHVERPAPDRIQFVQLPDSTVLDTSGGSLVGHALDAIRYALARAKPDQHVIVNLSYGTHSGGHDATSIWDVGLNELLDRFDGKSAGSEGKTLHVVLPAGNSHEWRSHAGKRLTRCDPCLQLRWKIQPDNPLESFLEIWLPDGARVNIVVTAPDGSTVTVDSATRPQRTIIEPVGSDGEKQVPHAALIWPKQVPQSDIGTMVLLAVGPTARQSEVVRTGNAITRNAFRQDQRPAPHGIWTVLVERLDGAEDGLPVHAWVQRSDSAPGRPRRAGLNYPGRQSFLLEQKDHAVTPEFTLNGLASMCHPRLYVVGAMRREDVSLSDHSAAGPNRINPERFHGPDRVVVGDESLNVPGLLTQGFFGGARLRLSGTSLAAAAFTRMLYEHLSDRSGHGPLHAAPLRIPSRDRRVPEGSPRHAAAYHRGEGYRLLPDHPFGRLRKWPPPRR